MQEVVTPHTGLLRYGLAVEQSKVFWQKADQDWPLGELRQRAVRQSWFPGLSPTRTRYVVAQQMKRFPLEARKLLRFAAFEEDHRNRLVCHWHLQVTDPVYRDYTAGFLLHRWTTLDTHVSLESTIRWVEKQPLAAGWQPITVRRLASGLLSAATEAGLCVGIGKEERTLRLPPVDRQDRSYLAGLLKIADALGNAKTYLMSVGQSAIDLEEESS